MLNLKTFLIALSVVAVAALPVTGCGASACDEITQEFAACSDSSDITDGQSADCNDAQEACAQCYLDSPKDICTQLLEMAADCSEFCSSGI